MTQAALPSIAADASAAPADALAAAREAAAVRARTVAVAVVDEAHAGDWRRLGDRVGRKTRGVKTPSVPATGHQRGMGGALGEPERRPHGSDTQTT